MRIRPHRHWGVHRKLCALKVLCLCSFFHHACWPVRRLPPSRPFFDQASARCCPSDRQPLAPRRQPAFVTGDGRMPSPHASRCGMMCHYFQLVLVPPWRRLCRARPIRDASDEESKTTTTTTVHVIGSVVAIKIMFGTAAIGPTQTDLANAQIIQKEIKPAAVPVPFVYRSA